MTAEGFLLSIGFLLAILLGFVVGAHNNFTLDMQHAQRKRDRILWRTVDNATRSHSDTLLSLVNQLRTTDAQGKPDYNEAHKYIYQFIENVILRDLLAAGVDPIRVRSNPVERDKIFIRICDTLSDHAEKLSPQTIEGIETGEDFERMCGLVLKDRGWDVTTVARTGEHGVDLIATKSDVKVLLRCRFQTAGLGEQAIFDAEREKEQHQAHFAGIVSDAVFTPEARRLAADKNVLIIHHEDLVELENAVNLVS